MNTNCENDAGSGGADSGANLGEENEKDVAGSKEEGMKKRKETTEERKARINRERGETEEERRAKL